MQLERIQAHVCLLLPLRSSRFCPPEDFRQCCWSWNGSSSAVDALFCASVRGFVQLRSLWRPSLRQQWLGRLLLRSPACNACPAPRQICAMKRRAQYAYVNLLLESHCDACLVAINSISTVQTSGCFATSSAHSAAAPSVLPADRAPATNELCRISMHINLGKI